MVVGEILTGIALVNSAAKSIKELCSNARDVSSLGSYIDELFEGQKQVNRNYQENIHQAEQPQIAKVLF